MGAEAKGFEILFGLPVPCENQWGKDGGGYGQARRGPRGDADSVLQVHLNEGHMSVYTALQSRGCILTTNAPYFTVKEMF